MKTYQLKLRATETLVHAANEMQRVPHTYGWISSQWTTRSLLPDNTSGHKAFALSKAALWRALALSAQADFDAVLYKHPPPTELPLRSLLLRPDFKYS